MSEEHGPQVGRLAMRHEGAMWNAYWAKPDTMEGATLLGSIRMSVITADPEMKQLFMDLMRVAVAMAFKEATGISAEWDGGQTAPEHERAGNA